MSDIPYSPLADRTAGLTARLAYAGYLLVWNSRSLWMRPLVAGIAAPLVAATLLPVLVAPAGHDPYFVRLLGTSGRDKERPEPQQMI